MAIPNLTKPQLNNMSRDQEYQENKEGGEKKTARNYRQQPPSSSAEFMFISMSALQVL